MKNVAIQVITISTIAKKCGHRRTPVSSLAQPLLVEIDSKRISDRMAHLQHYRSEKPYQRQKSAMQKQLESFLWSSPNKKTLSSASPNDIVSFPFWRDKFGKTKLHRNSCQSKNELGGSILLCSCPKVLAAGKIDNNIGKLRALFKEHGRGVTWNDDLNVGNPAAHRSVKEYHPLFKKNRRSLDVSLLKQFLFFWTSSNSYALTCEISLLLQK